MSFSKEILAGSSGQSTGVYNGVVETSAMFNDGDSDHLEFTPASAGNQKICTISAWVKRSSFGNASAFENVVFHAGTASGHRGHLRFYEDHINWNYYNGSSWILYLITSGEFNDTSQWYHLCANVDTVAGTAKLFVNGVEPALSSGTIPSSSQDLSFADDVTHQIGQRGYGPDGTYFDGYIADVHFIDGTDLDFTSFAEFKNGVLIPKLYTGSYGTNGFHLEFKNTGTGTASSSTVGADTSGNNNHFTSTGHPTGAQPDCPENNTATWNILVRRRNGNIATFSEGNTKVAGKSSQVAHTSTTIASKKKHYAEFYINNSSYAVTSCGVVRTLWDGGLGNSYASNYGGSYYSTTGKRAYNATEDSQTAPSSDRVGIEVDFANNEVEYFTVASNGTRTSRGGKLTSSDGIEFGGEGVFTATTHDVSSSYIEAYFSESTWHGTPNSGYEELTTAKAYDDDDLALGAHAAEQPTDNFNSILYTGDASSTRAITGVGFQPDWVWFAQRNNTSAKVTYDSSRGVNKMLQTNDTTAEDDSSQYGYLSVFGTDGFTAQAGSTNNNYINENSVNIVAWNWKANGGTTTTNDASATSVGTIDSVIQANTKAGFSIVTYTGTGSAGTIAHGLGAVPKWYFTKRRSNSGHWEVYHASNTTAPSTEHLRLSANDATGDDSQYFNDTDPTSTVFSVGDHVNVNETGNTYVAYCFAEVEGYSRFGEYKGSGNGTYGCFVYTGFRPAWLMIKRTDSANNWHINDNKRDPNNPVEEYVYADTTGAEDDLSGAGAGVDFLANGFFVRDTTAGVINASGGDYIFMAFADMPFKYNNAALNTG